MARPSSVGDKSKTESEGASDKFKKMMKAEGGMIAFAKKIPQNKISKDIPPSPKTRPLR